MAARHGAPHQKVIHDPASPGWSWLDQEESKLAGTLKQCNRDAEREWGRIQRSHPELKEVAMPNLGVSSHHKMWAEVKWMLKRKVEEQDARAKRMALRIQRLEADAEQADGRRADLERAMGSMANSNEKELQDHDAKIESLQREKEVLLDELEKRCSELEHVQVQLGDLKKTEETTTWAFKNAVQSSENSSVELKHELKHAKGALDQERARAKEDEREHQRERVEVEVKMGRLESQVEEMRKLSTEMEHTMSQLRAEVLAARLEVDVEKQRNKKKLHDMHQKLDVWSEEGSPAIHEARQMATAADEKARERELELERDAEGSLLTLEMRIEEQVNLIVYNNLQIITRFAFKRVCWCGISKSENRMEKCVRFLLSQLFASGL